MADPAATIREACPFCDYAGPSEILHDWFESFVIEPLNPVTPGHLLVIPKKHVERADEDLDLTADLFRRSAWMLRGEDYNLIQSNGEAATQTVAHMHIHLVPRRTGDGLMLPWSPVSRAEAADTLAANLELIATWNPQVGAEMGYPGLGYEAPRDFAATALAVHAGTANQHPQT